MARAKRWLRAVRRTFVLPSSCRTVSVLDGSNTSTTIYNPIPAEETDGSAVKESSCSRSEDNILYKEAFSLEELAAVRIQACFRGHLARRAFRALRSLVRLQAVVRGVCVRRQTRVAIHCMQALVRLQVSVRARQLLSSKSGDSEVSGNLSGSLQEKI